MTVMAWPDYDFQVVEKSEICWFSWMSSLYSLKICSEKKQYQKYKSNLLRNGYSVYHKLPFDNIKSVKKDVQIQQNHA